MKRLIFLPVFIFVSVLCFSQGKYAGPILIKLINKTFTDEKNIPGLKGYELREGSMITGIDDPQPQFLSVLIKGKNRVVILSVKEDTVTTVQHIVDVIEIKNVLPGWEIRTAGCQNGDSEGEIIVALVNPGKGQTVKSVSRAWRCNRDKIRFEKISTKKINCINEVQD